ncbi:hypothetical protein FRC01_010728 [Tulasnella sp. 417]|nr:hypothetical protein FRC01_010728 [Tulasnella sp. 417]
MLFNMGGYQVSTVLGQYTPLPSPLALPSHCPSREDARAQTNGYSGASHARFSDLNSAVAFSAVPLDQQPQWVRDELGVPEPAAANPIPAAGPPPPASSALSSTPLDSATHPANTPITGNSVVRSSSSVPIPNPAVHPLASPIGSLVDTFRSIRIHAPLPQSRALNEHDADDSYNNTSTQSSPQSRSAGPRGVHGRRTPQSPVTTRYPSGRPPSSGVYHTTPAASPLQSPTRSRVLSAHHMQPRANDSRSLSHNNTFWTEDSILSDIFHRRAPSAGPSPSARNDGGTLNSSSSVALLDPMESIPDGLYGARDSLPSVHRIALRNAPGISTHYSPHDSSILGQRAVDYMFMHYFSAGSAMVVANAYLRFEKRPQRFVEHMVGEGLPPRQAAYLWAIICPETLDEPDANSSFAIHNRAGGHNGSVAQGREGVDADGSESEGREEVHSSPVARTQAWAGGVEASGPAIRATVRQEPDYIDMEIDYSDSPDEEENTQG